MRQVQSRARRSDLSHRCEKGASRSTDGSRVGATTNSNGCTWQYAGQSQNRRLFAVDCSGAIGCWEERHEQTPARPVPPRQQQERGRSAVRLRGPGVRDWRRHSPLQGKTKSPRTQVQAVETAKARVSIVSRRVRRWIMLRPITIPSLFGSLQRLSTADRSPTSAFEALPRGLPVPDGHGDRRRPLAGFVPRRSRILPRLCDCRVAG